MDCNDRRDSGRARRRFGPAAVLRALPTLTLALALGACVDEPTRPNNRSGKDDGIGPTPPRVMGLVEVTISGLGSGQVTSSAISARYAYFRPANADDSGDGTIQLELLSTGSFTHGTRGKDGYRYLYATYRVRNA